MRITAAIFGCSGTSLTDAERDFFRRVQPWGFILFGRNIDTPQQVSALVSELKRCVEHEDVPILIDQEGGRVRRLRPPHWPAYVSGEAIGNLFTDDPEKGRRLAWVHSRLLACDLQALGINVNCLPVLDIPVEGSHDVIGDRAYGKDRDLVSEIGQIASDGLLDGGVLPVIKHIPGHGRTRVDSHNTLPVVDVSRSELEETDFYPFKKLAKLPLAMTAHVMFTAVDTDAPATLSSKVVEDVIRGHIGFDGLLMCDDLSMHALSGDYQQRTKSAFAAGCDVVLHCNGDMSQMEAVAEASLPLDGKPLERALAATALLTRQEPCDEQALRKEYSELAGEATSEADPTAY